MNLYTKRHLAQYFHITYATLRRILDDTQLKPTFRIANVHLYDASALSRIEAALRQKGRTTHIAGCIHLQEAARKAGIARTTMLHYAQRAGVLVHNTSRMAYVPMWFPELVQTYRSNRKQLLSEGVRFETFIAQNRPDRMKTDSGPNDHLDPNPS